MTLQIVRFIDVVRDVSGGNAKLPQSEFQPSGKLAIVDQGQRFIAGYTDDMTCQFRSESLPVVVFGDHTKAIKYIDFPFAMGADGVKVLKTTDECDSKYLYHFLRQAKIPDAGYSRHFKFLKELEIPLPPLPDQRRIAAILDKADALRAKRREAIARLDQLLQSVFLEVFGDPVTNPKGWEFQKVGNILARKSCNGAYYPSEYYVPEGGTPMVHMSDAFYGTVRQSSLKRVAVPEKDIEKYGLSPSDILISRRSLTYEGSAKPCLIEDIGEPLIFESSLIRLTPDAERVIPIYLYHFLNNARARSKYVFKHVTKSTISGISQSGLHEVEIMIPSIELQAKFAQVVSKIDTHKRELVKAGVAADQLFQSLQQQAFTGTL